MGKLKKIFESKNFQGFRPVDRYVVLWRYCYTR